MRMPEGTLQGFKGPAVNSGNKTPEGYFWFTLVAKKALMYELSSNVLYLLGI